MRFNQRKTLLALGFAAYTWLISQAHADPIQLTSASQLNSSDIQLSIESASQPLGYVSPGNSISFTTADTLTFSRSSGHFEVDQANVNYGGTAFTTATYLVGAGGFQGSGDGGPITLSFATPVVQFGLNVEEFDGGPYRVTFLALDARGDFLTTTGPFGVPISTPVFYTAIGDDPLDGTAGTLSFEGLTSYSDPIAKVIFYDTPSGSDDLLFGNIRYLPSGFTFSPPPVPPPLTSGVTPEPGSFFLLGTGLLSAPLFLNRMKGLSRKSSAAR